MRTKNNIIIFVILMLVMLVLISQSEVYAANVESKNGIKANIAYYDGLVTGKKNVIISVNEKNKNTITKEEVINLYEGNKITDIKNKDGANLLDADTVKTNDKVVTADGEYVVILVGDSNCDGIICDTDDIMTIIDDFLGRTKLKGEQKLAANLMNSDELLDTDDIMIMMNRYLGKVEKLLSNNLPVGSIETINVGEEEEKYKSAIDLNLTILDENSAPVSNAKLKVTSNEGEKKEQTTTTNAQGKCIVEIPLPAQKGGEKTYEITVSQLDESNKEKDNTQIGLNVKIKYDKDGKMTAVNVETVKGNNLVKEKTYSASSSETTTLAIVNVKISQGNEENASNVSFSLKDDWDKSGGVSMGDEIIDSDRESYFVIGESEDSYKMITKFCLDASGTKQLNQNSSLEEIESAKKYFIDGYTNIKEYFKEKSEGFKLVKQEAKRFEINDWVEKCETLYGPLPDESAHSLCVKYGKIKGIQRLLVIHE